MSVINHSLIIRRRCIRIRVNQIESIVLDSSSYSRAKAKNIIVLDIIFKGISRLVMRKSLNRPLFLIWSFSIQAFRHIAKSTKVSHEHISQTLCLFLILFLIFPHKFWIQYFRRYPRTEYRNMNIEDWIKS